MKIDLDDAEWMDIRTALLIASAMADTATDKDRRLLDRKKWDYLKIAEKIGENMA